MAGLTSLLSSSLKNKLNERKKSVLLWKFTPTGSRDFGFQFQYFPETLSDTKAINYSPREALGGNLPIYQWINGGERLITFTAMFTTDLDPGYHTRTELTERSQQRQALEQLKEKGYGTRNVDVRGAITYLRSCLMPTYETDKVIAPPVLILEIPGSGIGIAGGHAPENDTAFDSIWCLMTQCDVEYRQFFPQSGLPRIAAVTLAFAQVGQFAGGISFPGLDETVQEDGSNYLLKPGG